MHRGLLVLTILLAPLAAHAQMGLGPIPGEEKFAGLLPQKNNVGAGLGFAQMQEDYFVQLVLRTELNLGPVGLGLQVPLNLRVRDQDPKNTGDYYGTIRKEDWDQTSDYLRVIRYVRLGHKRDTIYLRVGEQAADLGHGTILNRYLNNVDPTNLRVGSSFDVNTKFGGVETFIADLGAIADSKAQTSRLTGARVYFKPYSLIDADSWINMFAVGATYVTDLNAPMTTEVDPTTQRIAQESAYSIWGLDLEAELLHNALVDMVPYTDLNFMKDAGWGLHAGVLTTFKLPIGIALSIPVRLEYRRFSSDYMPGYFDTFYEVQRLSYAQDPVTGTTWLTKAQYAEGLKGGSGYNGVYGDLAFDFAGLIQVGAVYEARQGADANLQVFASVPAVQVLQAKAFYARTGITGTNDVFVFDDRSMAVAQLRYELYPYLYLVGRGTRRWVPVETSTTCEGGVACTVAGFKSKDDWNAGIEFAVEL